VTTQDLDYIRKLDSLARFYNSQGTAHIGYLITSIVIYCAVFNIFQPAQAFKDLLQINAFASSSIVVVIFLVLLPVWIWMPFSSRYQLARTQFYMQLSEIVWEHMGVNNPKAFESLKERTTSEYTSIQAAVYALFEARLYRSLWKKERKCEPPEVYNGQRWMDVFNPSEHPFGKAIEKYDGNYEKLTTSEEYERFLPAYHPRKILRIWKLPGFDYTDLLWTAHRGTVKSYPENDPRFLLFKGFLDG
jgi:hypothetical protein